MQSIVEVEAESPGVADEAWWTAGNGGLAPVPREDNAYYLGRQSARESNARSYPRRLPLALKQGRGIHVEDADGRRYIDCLAGAGALALGHHHPVVVEAIQQLLADGTPFQTLDLTTPVKDAFVEELFACLPPDFAANARIQFCGPSGADAWRRR
ncbi:aminotransferase class III-fold pyridoxal phosphate-dependent enzyme [Methylogaea oryzae]|uniref:aminotransferase class III-fold pyridoxal phosphate-dependent enzyme n=1 Tax=Methylogaea oryzae TaxID=1295382 RepID=UPI0026E568D9|nr:aminotransferase class III-fold pyridoxal phosphate-dependent enzyme [Methylogaea oryzae]